MSETDIGNLTDNRLLLLDDDDNILGVARPIRAGETIPVNGEYVRLDRNAGIGFKIARNLIKEGDSIKKYGAIIGTASADINVGQLVHVHNMKSNYLANTELAGTGGEKKT